MPEIFAFAGKGGVGKTTLGGLLIRYLTEVKKGGPVLAVDAEDTTTAPPVTAPKNGHTASDNVLADLNPLPRTPRSRI